MIKIFVAEYIYFLEDFDLLFLYDNFFSQHNILVFPEIPPNGWLEYKKVFLTNDLTIFTRTKFWRFNMALYKFRIVATQIGHPIYYTYYLVPRVWFRKSILFGLSIPPQYTYVQFYNLNYLVGISYINFERYYDYYDDINIRSIDINLLVDSVYGIFTVEEQALNDWLLKGSLAVFYKIDPYKYELLLIGLNWYPPFRAYSFLNPYSIYLTQGIFYAKKWLIYAYLTYNKFPDLNRSEYMYNLSSFFTVLDFYRIKLFNFEYVYLDNFILLNFNIFKFYFKLNLFLILCFGYIYSCNKKNLFSYAYLKTPLYFFSPLLSRILVVSSFLKRYIRLRNYYWLKKKFKRGFERKSETENYYFSLIRKHLFRRLFKLYNKYILNVDKYLKKLNDNYLSGYKDYMFIYWFYLILVSFFFFFLKFILFLKTIIYYIYYFYHLKLNKYINLKNTIFLFIWFIPEIVLLRDVESFDSFEVLRRYMNFKRYHRKKEYRKYLKSKVLDAYETRMWEKTQIDENIKQQYVNYFYHRYFFDYEPWYEFLWILLPRFLSKFNLQVVDPSLKDLPIYRLATLLNFHYGKLFFIKKPKHVKILYALNYFFSFNFWRLFYFYVYKLARNKSNNSYKFLELWILFLYKWYLYICFSFSSILKILFTSHRIILPYYFFKSLSIAYEYLNNFLFYYYFMKFCSLLWNISYITLYYSFEIFYVNISKFFIFVFTRLNNFSFFLLRSDYGFSFNFWYKYYIFKFYLFEYNIIYHFFIFLRNLVFNFLIIFSIFYIFFSLPFVNNIFYNYYVLFFFENIFNFLYNLHITSFIDYTLNIDNIYILIPENFQHVFDNFVFFYTNNFANYYLDFYSYIGNTKGVKTKWYFRFDRWDEIQQTVKEIVDDKIAFFGFDRSVIFNLPPIVVKFWIILTAHLYFVAHGSPAQFMMWEFYWYNLLPPYFHWVYQIKHHIIYVYLLLPCFWIWEYLVALITFICLYVSSFIPPLYYLVFFFFKFMYIIYSYIYLIILYIYYFYSYYFLIIYSKLYVFLFNFFQLIEIFEYDSLKFYITLDILNCIKLVFNTIFIFFYYFFSGIFLYFYKILSWFLSFFGFDYFNNLDFFSFSNIQEFRSFTGKFFTNLLPLHYDLNEYNGIFDDRIHNRVGKRRGYKIRPSRILWYPHIKFFKFRTITFEYKIRGFLFKDTAYLTNMFLYEHLFEFRNWNLFYFMLFSLYFHFFLVLFFTGIVFIKFINIFKDTRYIPHSGSYEWKRNFIKKNKMKFGLDDFYWLYNVRWLKSFEFYLDKHFRDDLYVYKFNRSKLQFALYLYDTLNEVFLTENPTISNFFEENRYHKFRRYYFDRYTIFVKDIDYLFHIYSVSKRNLKMRSKIFSIFNFHMPFFKKKKNDMNYIYDNEILHKLDRMDFVWIFYVTPNLLYGRDWYDMKVFSQNLVTKELYNNLKRSLFKAYAIYEMNQKEFPFDLFEFQFFDKDFYNSMVENYGNDYYFEDIDNPILRKLSYSRYHNTLLYTSIEGIGFKKIYNLIGYEEFLSKMEDYFIYLKKINKNYFNNFIDFNLFSFMESISYTLTHINPDIAKTAVDIDRGRLIGVSYRKSMLLDEFTSTEITESVFNAVDGYLKKSNFNNIDVFNMLLREDRITVVRSISPLWIVFAIIPFFFLYLQFDIMFKYGRFILPHFALIEAFSFITDQIFGIYFSDNYAWHGLWIHDHRNWNKRLRYQFKLGHIRGVVWDLRWADLHSFWTGKNAYLVQAKLDYSYLFIYWLNDSYPRKWLFDRFWDYYIKDFFKYFFIRVMFYLFDLFAFFVFFLFIYTAFLIFFITREFVLSFNKENFETEVEVEYRKTGDAVKTFKMMQDKEKKKKEYRNRDLFIDINKEIDKHKRLVEFIEEYKDQQKKKEENKKNL